MTNCRKWAASLPGKVIYLNTWLLLLLSWLSFETPRSLEAAPVSSSCINSSQLSPDPFSHCPRRESHVYAWLSRQLIAINRSRAEWGLKIRWSEVFVWIRGFVGDDWAELVLFGSWSCLQSVRASAAMCVLLSIVVDNRNVWTAHVASSPRSLLNLRRSSVMILPRLCPTHTLNSPASFFLCVQLYKYLNYISLSYYSVSVVGNEQLGD